MEDEPLPLSSIQDAYHISKGQRMHVDLTGLVTSNDNDPAYKVSSFCTK